MKVDEHKYYDWLALRCDGGKKGAFIEPPLAARGEIVEISTVSLDSPAALVSQRNNFFFVFEALFQQCVLENSTHRNQTAHFELGGKLFRALRQFF